DFSVADTHRIIEALCNTPGASQTLRQALEAHAVRSHRPGPSPSRSAITVDADVVNLAMNPPLPAPQTRKLRVFAYDPLLSYDPDFLQINETILEVNWEELEPGPVGEYVEVVDVDPSTGVCYAPVDLNHPSVLSRDGLTPSESSPRFHQQMVYAVAM